jgi:hypothetical protein
VIKATHAACPELHNHWQVFVHARLLLLVQTHDNMMGFSLICASTSAQWSTVMLKAGLIIPHHQEFFFQL